MSKMRGLGSFLVSLGFLGFVLLGSSCKQGQSSGGKKNNSIDIPPEVAAAYREDAARLAVRDLSSMGVITGESEGVIPVEMTDKYYQALCKIYILAKKIDSIPDLGQIHTLRRPDLKLIRVTLNDQASFKDNWSKGYIVSQDLYLNNLMGKHKMKIKEYKEGANGPMVLLESPNFINTTELSMLLRNVKGIESAEPEAVVGDGNNIESGSDGKNATAIKFSIGKGDCPSGCIYRKYWIFHLMPDKSVMFIGTKGVLPAGN